MLLATSGAWAQDWAKAMFDHTSHDFGMVARGAKVEHVFNMDNIYLEDAHIASVRSSCGCTTAQFPREIIKTYEKAPIVATIDTRAFVGRKDATLTVTLDKPFPTEVQLQVHCYIRSDVVFEPGAVNLGSVLQGSPVRKKVTVDYAGRNDWRITGLTCRNPYVETELVEVGRNSGRVTYDLWVELKPNAPVGYVKDDILLVTNDQRTDAQRVTLAVEGAIVPALSVRPSRLNLGSLPPGQSKTKNLVIQGQTPFRIVDAKGPDERFGFVLPETSKTVHVVPVTFTAGQQAGAVAGEIRIRTDLPGNQSLTVKVDGEVAGAGALGGQAVPSGSATPPAPLRPDAGDAPKSPAPADPPATIPPAVLPEPASPPAAESVPGSATPPQPAVVPAAATPDEPPAARGAPSSDGWHPAPAPSAD